MFRSAYLFAHDPNTVKSELNKAMALARSKSDLGWADNSNDDYDDSSDFDIAQSLLVGNQ